MKLNKITAQNLKGLSFNWQLSKVNFLVGANFAGKSARTDALRLLLVGHLPELGKRSSDTFGLSSGRELSVEGEFDDGTKIRRKWFSKGDSVKSDDLLPDAFVEPGALVVMLNAEEYFSLSERDRTAYVFRNIPGIGGGRDAQGIVATLEDSLQGKEGLKGENIRKMAEALYTSMVEEIQAGEPQGGWNPQAYLELALMKVKGMGSMAKEAAGRMEKTVQGLSQLRLKANNPVDTVSLQAKRDALNQELLDLHRGRADLDAAARSQSANRAQRQMLTRELEGKPAAADRIKVLLKQLVDAEELLISTPNATAEDARTLRIEERAVSAACAGHQADLRNLEQSIRKNQLDLAEIEHKEVCPYCGASGSNWKGTKKTEIEAAMAGLAVKLKQTRDHVGKLTDQSKQMLSRVAGIESAAALRVDRDRKVQAIKSDLANARLRESGFKAKEEQLKSIPAEDPEVMAKAETARSNINVKEGELRAMDAQLREAAGLAHELKRLAQAETSRDEEKATEVTCKAAADELRALQGQLVTEAFGPLLEKANAFIAGILKSPLAYRDGEIGTWRDGAWVGHRTFSGTEKALAYAAIQAALAASAPVKLMILDELGRLDAANAALVAERAKEAVLSGLVDQFVGIDTRPEIYAAFEDDTCQVLAVR